MDSLVLNVFLAITGAMIIPLVPLSYLRILDNTIGRFVLLMMPILAYYYVSPESGVMVGVVVGLTIDRLHDLAQTNVEDLIGSGRLKDKHEVLLDLSPDYTKEGSNEIVMLEPVEIRRKHGIR